MSLTLDPQRRYVFRPVGAWGRIARRTLFSALGAMTRGCLEVQDADGTRVFGRSTPEFPLKARIRIFDPATYGRVALGGSIGAGEAYAEGLWGAGDGGLEDLTAVCRVFVANRAVLDAMDSGMGGLLRRAADAAAHRLRGNSVAGARKNIRAHYDLGNDFFRLFLDDTWMYSSGVFADGETSLAGAQRSKNDRICRKLRLTPHDHLLEIGTGWGGFALHAAREYGCRVTTTTISRAQYEVARERVRAAGLEGRVQLLLEDYRALKGGYDKLVSIEMIEAVGLDRLGEYFGALSRLLASDGAAAVQSILIQERYFKQASRSVDFIQKHIFPGSGIPSVGSIMEAAGTFSDLRLVHLEDFASHYARTLRFWYERFRASRPGLSAAGYGDWIQGLWRFYFSYCEAGFIERQIGVAQLLFAKPDSRMEPVLGAL